jgi:cellulose synthase/poly-beta-1,6-N-acetylglucosamine synthase-like glycosyltransferase
VNLAEPLRVLAFASIGLVAYAYLLYPFVLLALAALAQMARDAGYSLAKKDRRRSAQAPLPPVAVVIAAYNEEAHIGTRIANLRALDYPPHLLKAYIGSDGSSDRTAGILRAAADARVLGFVFETNRGKASVLNDLVARTTEPILVFSDANTVFDPEAVRQLVAHFADPSVGAISGELRLLSPSHGNNQDSLYWRTEQFLKFFEARIGGLLGANGAIYAIRRSLWQPLSPNTICDDFCVAMSVAAAGHRLVYEPRAWAVEDTPETIGEEHRRRVRIGIGNFQALLWHPEYLVRTSMATRFTYLSHKVLRWVAPHLLIVGALASLALAPGRAEWAAFAAVQIAGYATAALLYLASERGARLPGVLRIAAFLFALNWAFLIASWRFATGRYGGSWRRSSR